MLKTFYEEIHGDYHDVIDRLVDEKRVLKFVLFFLQDNSYMMYKNAIENQDETEAFRAIHTLKGVCMNLGFSQLYEIASEITELLRNHHMDLAIQKMTMLDRIYAHHIEAIQRLQKG